MVNKQSANKRLPKSKYYCIIHEYFETASLCVIMNVHRLLSCFSRLNASRWINLYRVITLLPHCTGKICEVDKDMCLKEEQTEENVYEILQYSD